jgi:hypothetical protein
MPDISYLAKEGDIAPGTGGATFSGFGIPVANNNGEVLIGAFLSGGTSGASEGLFVLRSGGAHGVVALGDTQGGRSWDNNPGFRGIQVHVCAIQHSWSSLSIPEVQHQ